jgi:hypothetical protein
LPDVEGRDFYQKTSDRILDAVAKVQIFNKEG